MLRPVPITLKQANALISSYHRHHAPVVGLRFAIGCEKDGKLVGAAIVGRPVARMTNQYNVAEVTRLVTDGTKNACSCLYSACARAADAMGYQEIQTFILESEPGTSLLASGWEKVGRSAGGDWNRPSRGGRRTDQPQAAKMKYRKRLSNWDPRTKPEPPASVAEQAQDIDEEHDSE